MADKTGIEWTEATWNPIVGCTAVSPGCDHCYAAREASGRLAGLPLYRGLAAGGVFTGEVRLVPERLDQPLRWRRPRRIFVNSMSDLFHDGVPDDYIAHVFAIMALAEAHTFQVLTKRHGRMRSLLNDPAFAVEVQRYAVPQSRLHNLDTTWASRITDPRSWPLRNVWLGVSVETQQWADIRIAALLRTPAALRWLSCEPLLGMVGITKFLHHRPVGVNLVDRPLTPAAAQACGLPSIDWVVAGGESGPAARPMNPAWAMDLRDQCTDAGIPFLFKQWGEWAPFEPGVGTGRELRAYPGYMVKRLGKKIAGRVLDGRTWDEYPVVAHG